jgi:hypothetical protein
MMVLTSAKSTLMSPGLRMMSQMPNTPCLRTSSATENASSSGAPSGRMCSSRSLETTIRVSTFAFRFMIAS